MEKTIWQLKTTQRAWPCSVCGEDVHTIAEMRGKFFLCNSHRNWRGYFKSLSNYWFR